MYSYEGSTPSPSPSTTLYLMTVPAPTLIGPGSTTPPGTPSPISTMFQWHQVASATSYLLQFKDVTKGTGITNYPISGGSTTSFSEVLNDGDAYWWNMYAYVGSAVSPVSTTYNFTVNNPPDVSSVSNPQGTQSGVMYIDYGLSDAESDPCSIQVQYSTDDSTWHTPTQYVWSEVRRA